LSRQERTVAQCAAQTTAIRAAECMAAVFQNRKVSRSCKLQNGIDVRRNSVTVLDDDGLRLRRQCPFDVLDGRVVRRRIDVRIDRPRPGVEHRIGHHNARVTGHEHIVALADAQSTENGKQGHPPFPESHRLGAAKVHRERPFVGRHVA